MTFDYSTSGLPGNKQWENAAQRCHAWLTMHMRQFGPERIINFMHNQPVAAAKRLFETCPDYTQESITVLMLGPAKGDILEDEALAEKNFGARTVALIKTLVDPASAVDDQMRRDAGRIFIAEAISTMNDQMIGRTKPGVYPYVCTYPGHWRRMRELLSHCRAPAPSGRPAWRPCEACAATFVV